MNWQYLIPKKTLTTLAGKLAECSKPWMKNTFINFFIKHYKVDLQEAIYPDPEHYKTFNDFFTRHLKPSCRPFSKQPDHIICPADGFLSEYGQIHNSALLQAKNHKYSLTQLLANQTNLISHFTNGQFMTVYLAPHNYHRVHMPLDGHLLQAIYVPGKLFSVNFKSAQAIPNLFSMNERLILSFQTSLGPAVVIFVGATIVGNIVTQWTGSVTELRKKGSIHNWDFTNQNILCEKGSELGYFQLGSTVILLFPNQSIEWQKELHITQSVKMGQTIATSNDASLSTIQSDVIHAKE